MSKFHVEPKELNGNINVINDNVVSIKNVNELKRADLDEIYDLLKSRNGEVIITSSEKNINTFKQAIHISDDNKSEVFNNTEKVDFKEYDPKNTKFIKSHLPFAKAFKIGASSLKSKPIRMIFTIILTVVALIMFGVTSTLMLYDQSYSVKEALKESDNDYEQINKSYQYESIYHTYNLTTDVDEVNNGYTNYDRTAFSKTDIDYLNSKSVNKYAGVIKFSNNYGSNYAIQFNSLAPTGDYYQYRGVSGLVDAGLDFINQNGFRVVAGEYPTKPDEIAISNYLFETFKSSDNKISSYNDLIGKEFDSTFSTNNGSFSKKLKITAVIDFGQIPAKFDELKNENTTLNQKALNDLKEKYKNYIQLSFHALGYVSSDFYSYYKKNYNISSSSKYYINSIYVRGLATATYNIAWDVSPDSGSSYISPKIIDKIGLTFTDFDGKNINFVSPKEDECYISEAYYKNYLNEKERFKYQAIYSMLDSDLISETYSLTNNEKDEIRNIISRQNYTDEDRTVLDSMLANYNKFIKVYNAYNDRWNYSSMFEYLYPNWQDDDELRNKHYAFDDLFSSFETKISNHTFDYDNELAQIEELYKDGLLNKYYIYENAFYLNYNLPKEYSIIRKDEINDIINKDKNTLTAEDYETLNEILLENKITVNYDINKNNSVYNSKEPTLNVYYKTSTGKSGELKIIGLYSSTNDTSTFVLNDSFVNKRRRLYEEERI